MRAHTVLCVGQCSCMQPRPASLQASNTRTLPEQHWPTKILHLGPLDALKCTAGPLDAHQRMRSPRASTSASACLPLLVAVALRAWACHEGVCGFQACRLTCAARNAHNQRHHTHHRCPGQCQRPHGPASHIQRKQSWGLRLPLSPCTKGASWTLPWPFLQQEKGALRPGVAGCAYRAHF